MDKVSVIIPARGEKPENLERTLRSIYENATGEFEVIIGFNGKPYFDFSIYTPLITDKLKVIEFPENIGIKGNINALALLATGKYLFKLDAHCAVGKGFDEILKADFEDDWIVMPRFKIIKDDWSIQQRDGQEEFYDYFFMHCPLTDKRGYRFKAAGHWPQRTQERLLTHPDIDETPQIHGSAWFILKDRFFELGGFPLQDPYGHGQEGIWLGLKNWLKGGKVMTNKKTHYAHLHQDSKDRGYLEDRIATERTYKLVAEHWMFNKEPNLLHDIKWFINEKFPNMPGWPENWEQLQKEYESKYEKN